MNSFAFYSDLWKPGNPDAGEFVINRPHATFAMTAFFNKEQDPFPDLEENTMEEGDILLCSPQKTGRSYDLYMYIYVLPRMYSKYNVFT